jgi:hypothetical protein
VSLLCFAVMVSGGMSSLPLPSSSSSSFEQQQISALLSPVSFETFMQESYAHDVRYIPGDASRVQHLQEAADLHKAFDCCDQT